MRHSASMKKLIIIAGPTASGKTAVSIELAKRLGGEIISADSMQVYRGMDIGSAKVRKDEMNGVPRSRRPGDFRKREASFPCRRNRILYSGAALRH